MTWVSVSASDVETNARRLRRHVAPAVLIAVLKGDAYGHGLLACSAAARRAGAAMLAVGDVSEARAVRRGGDPGPILVLGPSLARDLPELIELGTEIVVSDRVLLQAVAGDARNARGPRLHVAVDTGLGREGFAPEELGAVIDALRPPRACLAGVMTQLRTASDPESAARQLALFRESTARLSPRVCRHIANSGGIALGPDYHLDAVRPGLALYGLSRHCREILPLRSCLTWRARVVEIHRRARHTRVGYAPGHRLLRDSRLGIVSVGYAHGYPRLARGPVLAGGRRVPVLGPPNMLTMIVDLTDTPDVVVGDVVTILGSDGADEVSALELCTQEGLIPQLFTCMFTRLVPRRPASRISPSTGCEVRHEDSAHQPRERLPDLQDARGARARLPSRSARGGQPRGRHLRL